MLAVDHNRILLEGIRVLIEMQPDLELAGVVTAPDAAVSLFAEKRPDLTLMDLDGPAHRALDAIRRIRDMNPAAWIIALVTYEWDERSALALEAGASAVLAKDLIGERLVPLIRARSHDGKLHPPNSG